jgi:hypothetical protein
MDFRSKILALAAFVLLAAAPALAVSGLRFSAPGFVATNTDDRTPFSPGPIGAPIAFAMAIRVKDAATVARKWVTRASSASPDYAAGVKEAGADWESNTLAGKENFSMGVQQAIADGRYEKGVREAGQGKYVARASGIGATRFAPGVQAAENEMARGVAPVLETIRSINLPPRRPKGDPGNMERANAVATALRKLKTGR